MSDSLSFLLRRLRFRHVQLLALLDDTGTVRSAAETMHLSQPAVSKMLGEVEAALGERLFERNRRGVVPNAFGRIAIHRARIVLGELSAVVEEFEGLKGEGSLLRLGTLTPTELVPKAVAALLRRHERSRIRMVEGGVQRLIDLLLKGELDCVFGALSPAAMESTPIAELDIAVVSQDRLCGLVSEASPIARTSRLRWQDLIDARWIVAPRSTLIGQAFVGAFTRLGLQPPQPVIEVSSPASFRSLLDHDPGLIALYRSEDSRRGLKAAGLKLLEVEPVVELSPLCLFTRRTQAPALPIVQAFREELLRMAAKQTAAAARKRAGDPRGRSTSTVRSEA